MKITKLVIKNIGKIAEETIVMDKPLLLFYGEIRQGKSTILNAVRWVCGGSFPQDIIRHGQKDASVTLEFDGGSIHRSWYVSDKAGDTRVREVSFVRDGKKVDKPVSEIEKFLNPFLLNQDHLRNMGETDRKKFFVDLFGIDTKELDNEYISKEREARDLRSKIKGYGVIDLKKVERVVVDDLLTKRKAITDAHAVDLEKSEKFNKVASERDSNIKRGKELISELDEKIARLSKELSEAQGKHKITSNWLENNPPIAQMSSPGSPNTASIDVEIQNAGAQNVRAEQYEKDLARSKDLESDRKSLSALESRMDTIKSEKIAKLKSISETSGIPDLKFDEQGNFTYQDTHAGMLSTSQIMQLSSEISAMYPEGFGLDLIDRGESLGASIFDFVDRAKRENKTILATIVGEMPAKTIPDDVGVFVVKEGTITKP